MLRSLSYPVGRHVTWQSASETTFAGARLSALRQLSTIAQPPSDAPADASADASAAEPDLQSPATVKPLETRRRASKKKTLLLQFGTSSDSWYSASSARSCSSIISVPPMVPLSTLLPDADPGATVPLDAIPSTNLVEVAAALGIDRPVRITDAHQLGLLPSVTSVLRIAAQPGIAEWRQSQLLTAALDVNEHLWQRGIRVLGVRPEASTVLNSLGKDITSVATPYVNDVVRATARVAQHSMETDDMAADDPTVRFYPGPENNAERHPFPLPPAGWAEPAPRHVIKHVLDIGHSLTCEPALPPLTSTLEPSDERLRAIDLAPEGEDLAADSELLDILSQLDDQDPMPPRAADVAVAPASQDEDRPDAGAAATTGAAVSASPSAAIQADPFDDGDLLAAFARAFDEEKDIPLAASPTSTVDLSIDDLPPGIDPSEVAPLSMDLLMEFPPMATPRFDAPSATRRVRSTPPMLVETSQLPASLLETRESYDQDAFVRDTLALFYRRNRHYSELGSLVHSLVEGTLREWQWARALDSPNPEAILGPGLGHFSAIGGPPATEWPNILDPIRQQVLAWVEDNVERIELLEPSFAHRYGFGGRADLVCVLKPRLDLGLAPVRAVVDFKTQNVHSGRRPRFPADWAAQLSAYAVGLRRPNAALVNVVLNVSPLGVGQLYEKIWTPGLPLALEDEICPPSRLEPLSQESECPDGSPASTPTGTKGTTKGPRIGLNAPYWRAFVHSLHLWSGPLGRNYSPGVALAASGRARVPGEGPDLAGPRDDMDIPLSWEGVMADAQDPSITRIFSEFPSIDLPAEEGPNTAITWSLDPIGPA
ncbi:hypothetical protein H696_01151 [Fonticula alba]|uniref:Uncharacterized protein n=1 Tax=Fonticula alba TaxID=691883 RepID=A0A058ZBD0_FONAL|nr:hypothetical protein H696_01151 [Fonticula alba]KCV71730.1 hypothetical protein H696_01151 [Fonticula alba]|eukprot:XP_009493308.1 hypothetical protein H696_01151 [Fonticula alba]